MLYLTPDSAFPSNETVLKVYPSLLIRLKASTTMPTLLLQTGRFSTICPTWMARYWWWILIALVVIGAGAYIWWRKKQGASIIPATPVKKENPVDAALRLLGELREEKLCQRGEEKLYYTRLTDILRIYLRDRFGINAMEMTSTQIRRALFATTRPPA